MREERREAVGVSRSKEEAKVGAEDEEGVQEIAGNKGQVSGLGENRGEIPIEVDNKQETASPTFDSLDESVSQLQAHQE